MSNKQIKILCYIKRYKKFPKILNKLGYTLDEYTEFQENFPDGSANYMIFSDYNFDAHTTVELTPMAEEILADHTRQTLNLSLSAIAVLISLAAFIRSFF